MDFVLTTAVWGEPYVRSFLDVCIPSLLAANNVPELCSYQLGRYIVCTRPRDREQIIQSEAYRRLSTLLPVELPDYSESFFVGNTHDAHNRAWRSVVEENTVPDRWIGFVTPDCLFANGSLGHFGRRMAAGKKAIVGFPLRVIEASFLDALAQEVDRSAGVLSISTRRLAKLGLQHVSPMSSCYLRDSRRFGHWPECLYFPVEEEGLVMRMLGGHCYAVNPSSVRLDHGITPYDVGESEIDFLTDSDDYMNVSLTALSHQTNWFLQPREQSNVATGVWYSTFCTPIYRHIARRPYLYHHADMTPDKWRAVISRSEMNVTLTLLASKFSWAVRELLQAGGMQSAAQLVAWALLHHGLHRAIVSRGKLSVILPADEAFEKKPEILDRVLAANRYGLRHLMRSITAAIDLDLACEQGTLHSLAGTQYAIEREGVSYRVGGLRAWRLASDIAGGGMVDLFACEGLLGAYP